MFDFNEKVDFKALFENIKNHSWTHQTLQFIQDYPIAVGGIAVGAMSFAYTYATTPKPKINLAFSEIEKTERIYKRENKEVPPITMFLSYTNDASMKVFEADNLSIPRITNFTDEIKAFAYEMEKKVEPTMRVHATIAERTERLPELCQKALHSLDKMTGAQSDLHALSETLSKVWDARHVDQYRTEIYYDTKCDSEGKNCQTVTRTQQVYDHTDHYYTYHKNAGNKAARLLNEFGVKHPDMRIDEKLVRVTSTEADNEYAMYLSMEKFKEKPPTVEDYIEMANVWATGSNFMLYTPVIQKNHTNLLSSAPQWDQHRLTAQSENYSTGSSHDAGPEEYQTINNARDYVDEMNNAINEITDGIKYVEQNALTLNSKSQEFVNVALNFKEGDAEKLASEVRELAKTMYKENFSGGFDVDPSNAGHVLMWTLIGAAAGAAAGAGYQLHEKKKRDQARQANYYDYYNRTRNRL